MKYITRWGLMRNTIKENISEHSLEVAMIAHALGIINNEVYGGDINPERLAVLGRNQANRLSILIIVKVVSPLKN
jgi:5'-deoxynucleotidase